ncbi:Uncharacterised protein [Mycoplasmopsis citelli]|uniref:Uncharacterized protein n=2 Tax=Mycoplasmopsis citelli TaxID=171281 RepID=A0A449B1Z0_9BACT|nr:Uncharacterised protein [Mycoplasmopsis citelli]
MENNFVSNIYVLIIIYIVYNILRIFFIYFLPLIKIKFFIQIFDLFFLKIKYNSKTWFLDELLKEAILTLIGKIKYQKRYLWINLIFESIINIATALSVFLVFLHSYQWPHWRLSISFLLTFFWAISNIFYLIILLYKIWKFENKFKKLNFLNLEKIKPIKKSRGNKDVLELNFLFILKNIYGEKMQNIILNAKDISNFFGKEAKVIMYIYRYDIDNFNAPYFVFENEQMIKNYEEAQW